MADSAQSIGTISSRRRPALRGGDAWVFDGLYLPQTRAQGLLGAAEKVHGMVRMFSILSGFESDVIQIFRDLAEAHCWFGLD